MIGLGYRKDMFDWNMQDIQASFFEVVPENWLRRNRDPLHQLIQSGRPVHLHGVSLNLGGHSPLNNEFLKSIRALMNELDTPYYSDHLACSGDAHQLYDLFPIPCTMEQVKRVSERIQQAQDLLGCQIAVENTTWYTNIGDMSEPDFLNAVLEQADCRLLLDLNNLAVNYKNHHQDSPESFLKKLPLERVTYLHVAGHEFDERFGLYVDTHSQGVELDTRRWAQHLQQQHKLPILLEWDNDIPTLETINQELQTLRHSNQHSNKNTAQKPSSNSNQNAHQELPYA